MEKLWSTPESRKKSFETIVKVMQQMKIGSPESKDEIDGMFEMWHSVMKLLVAETTKDFTVMMHITGGNVGTEL